MVESFANIALKLHSKAIFNSIYALNEQPFIYIHVHRLQKIPMAGAASQFPLKFLSLSKPL